MPDRPTVECSCGMPAGLVTGAAIYPHRPDLHGLSFYRCQCGAYVGCHKGTLNPLGSPADAATRAARKRAHAAFDPLWKQHGLPRRHAYAKLARALGVDEIHIGQSDIATCARIVDAAQQIKREVRRG